MSDDKQSSDDDATKGDANKGVAGRAQVLRDRLLMWCAAAGSIATIVQVIMEILRS